MNARPHLVALLAPVLLGVGGTVFVTGRADAQVVVPPLVGIPDLLPHGLCTNGLDPANCAEGTLQTRGFGHTTDQWSVTVQNTGTVSWYDFHVAIIGAAGNGLAFQVPATVTGWPGITTPTAQQFTFPGLSFKSGDFDAGSHALPPGGTIMLSFGVENVGTRSEDYYVQLRATTVPEPATWALLGAGLLTVGGMAQRRRTGTK